MNMDPPPDLTIIFLGNSGVGKSASGNTILGETVFESRRSFTSVTKQISERTGHVFGKKISVVDTPTIFGSEDTIRLWCRVNLDPSVPCLFLVVVRIDRFGFEQKNAVEAALRVTRHLNVRPYLLFTRGDDLGDMTLDDFINEDPDGPLRAVVDQFEERLHVFNNENGGRDQVKELLVKSGHLGDDNRPHTYRRMVLLGVPEGGKSASGNTILGSDKFESNCDPNPVTTRAELASATVEGYEVSVVDTPGVTDEVLKPKKLFKQIMKSVVKTDPGLHAFVIVVKLGRISKAHIKLFKILRELFGDDTRKYTMVLFTHGDDLKNRTIDEYIELHESLKELVTWCGRRYCVFNNKDRGNRLQVRQLLDKIDEMFQANGEEPYISEMFKMPPSELKVFIQEKWRKLSAWFTQKVKKIRNDERRGEYARLGDDAIELLERVSVN